MNVTHHRTIAFGLFAALALAPALPLAGGGERTVLAAQQKEEKFDFDIPPQVLGAAIPSFMHVTEIKINFTPELVAGKRTNGVFGSFDVEEGLQVLLDGTGLTYTFNDPKTVTLKVDAE